jgi:hypothetical protein
MQRGWDELKRGGEYASGSLLKVLTPFLKLPRLLAHRRVKGRAAITLERVATKPTMEQRAWRTST